MRPAPTLAYTTNLVFDAQGWLVIADLASKEYELRKPVPITLCLDTNDEVIAAFPQAELARSGETAAEAVEWLQSSMVTLYDLLRKKRPEQLGPLPARQLRVLGAYLGEKKQKSNPKA